MSTVDGSDDDGDEYSGDDENSGNYLPWVDGARRT
jgi:hypothetical protein